MRPAKQPRTTWNDYHSHEYGLYCNVNRKVGHPRWSQAKERRLGEFFKRDTLQFNGYGDQVASMYQERTCESITSAAADSLFSPTHDRNEGFNAS